jgi:hypothetical protein
MQPRFGVEVASMLCAEVKANEPKPGRAKTFSMMTE